MTKKVRITGEISDDAYKKFLLIKGAVGAKSVGTVVEYMIPIAYASVVTDIARGESDQ